MRLIDADALMKKICDNECGSVCDKECENAMCNFYDYIMEAPAVNRWIPCSERLPDIDVPVLTWDGRYTSVERRIEYFLYYDEETGHIERQYGEYWIDGVEGDEENPIGLRDGTATHWMPLPEPPKEE